jgi:hypothetical protein
MSEVAVYPLDSHTIDGDADGIGCESGRADTFATQAEAQAYFDDQGVPSYSPVHSSRSCPRSDLVSGHSRRFPPRR